MSNDAIATRYATVFNVSCNCCEITETFDLMARIGVMVVYNNSLIGQGSSIAQFSKKLQI